MSKNKTKKDLLEDYLYSEDFDYDVESDPVFKALKDSVTENARKTAEDLLGKYSQISGGGSVSSAAMSAATQGANRELSKLGEEIPELYELAKEMYNEKLAEKESKFRAALDYESHLAKHPNQEVFNETENVDKNEEATLPPVNNEPKPEENTEEKTYSKGDNGLTSGSLASKDTPKHQMDKNVFDMTKKLIITYLSTGQRSQADALYSKFKNSMSDSQRIEIQQIFKS